MKSNSVPLLFLILVLLAGCGGGSGGSGGSTVTLASIAVTPGQPFADPGATAQFTATGKYSDNTTKDLTALATWSSSNPSVATISNAAGSKGSAISIAVGITAITAVLEGVTGSASLTVTVGGNSGPGINVLAITVNGSLCSPATSAGYVNKPCVSVTVCSPGSATDCQTINDILLDTGSSGLRLFKQALTNPSVVLTPITSGTGILAECAHFADGSSDWGPIKRADIRLGNEPAVTVPIQVIDAAFGTVPASCGTPDTSPAAAGLNGILGVGLFDQDCGTHCAILASNGNYFSCSGAVCPGAAAPPNDQVSNPVTLLPRDNNGVIVQLPRVPLGGVTSLSGNLILGIGTSANNAPSASVTAYNTNAVGEIITTLSGTSYSHSIIDTGSNGLFFPPPSASQLPSCAPPNDNWFCPQSTVALSAVNAAASGLPKGTVSFQIGNFTSLLSSPNAVFSEVGGFAPGLFDWGLPFYFGRDVYVGFEGGTNVTLGSGPYFAY
jgi:uncharacterized protein DUF3443/Big-like domain-containing protein